MTQIVMSTQEQQLCEFLKDLPRVHKNRYTETAERLLLQSLFWSLAGGDPSHLDLFFPPHSRPVGNIPWKLRKAKGGADGDEFTEAARGKACGHIFKAGEATYRCKTCSADDTCVLCSRCYESSDHTGHMLYVSVSLGNSGCCDCGDPEAWKRPVHCAIHTANGEVDKGKGKGKAPSLPDDLIESIRMTIGRAFDYICDVISCSPEQLRLPKTKEGIMLDEKMSRLTTAYYDGDVIEDPCEYALLLWNDEKHTVNEVKDQVSRACKVTGEQGMKRAQETDDIGRSIIKWGFDIDDLLRVSKIIEQIKVTVTIRSARDTFREQMCGTIIEWLSDIAGCSVGQDHNILRQVVCEEMLKQWSTGSEASNAAVGMQGIDDHEKEDHETYRNLIITRQAEVLRNATIAVQGAGLESDDDEDDEDDGGGVDEDEVESVPDQEEAGEALSDDDEDIEVDEPQVAAPEEEHIEGRAPRQEADDPTGIVPAALMAHIRRVVDGEGDVLMNETGEEEDALENQEATLAGYPPPPPPPPPPPAPPQRTIRDRELTPSDSDTAEVQPLISQNIYMKANMEIPKTPRFPVVVKTPPKPTRYWLETSQAYNDRESLPIHENLFQRLRIDWLILFDLRMWKKVRVDLRDLYISTVVTIPQFKRVLGLRFAGLYTTLAQLYLIADREPDHSIINISLQMLTTPSITSEIVERGNFLTNLMAILYTFLTTRQVGHPHEIFPNATLAFDSGSVTNRRMYHFFMDLRYLFGSEHVQAKLRTEDRYILQFLDLVKLHQGICPNVRAVGEHVEYETDAWISASLITREINRLCRQFAESYKWHPGENPEYISNAIRYAAKAVILHSLGTERKRFTQAEIKEEIKFKKVGDYEFDTTEASNNVSHHLVVKFAVEEQPISFHHALHYTLSWLIECGKAMPREHLKGLLSFTTPDLLQKPKAMGTRTMSAHQYSPEDYIMAAFDYPLRVCAWLAQMKAGMWVRNGMSLRHQQGTYRGVSQRDVSHHRDIFLLQSAMVVCPPSRVLVSILDRYCLEHWMKGMYESKPDDIEDGQMLDIVEDMIHLLIVLISDRTSLLPNKDEPTPHAMAMRRDITHVLCFKPLSFSDICSKLPDKFQDQEECQEILDEMTTFKPPEGLSDVGTFELKPQYLEDVDPYIAHYNKNQREESENAYKNYWAKKTGRPASEIVFEAKLRPIETGAFSDLSSFTRTGVFAQIIYYSLLYPLKAEELTPTVPLTRVEAFLQVVLHLILLAIAEDKTDEDEMSEESLQSFVYIALTSSARSNWLPSAPASKTIVSILEMLSRREAFKACHPKITLVLKRMKQKRPRNFETAFARLGVPVDRISTASPANSFAVEERGRKKQAALERQAKVMAQFQQQQKNFLDNQGDIDWGEEDMSDETVDVEDHKKYWQFPSGTCILCQEETGKDNRLYGTFALITKSMILRQTNFQDHDFIREAANVPANLDRSAEHVRPYGLAKENREKVQKVTSDGTHIESERQVIGKGFPAANCRPGPVSVGCGHIMHFKCFEVYYEASNRRHTHQIARHHPERLQCNEFVCPLCKALGNAFLPIIWAPKKEMHPGLLKPRADLRAILEAYIGHNHGSRTQRLDAKPLGGERPILHYFKGHNRNAVSSPLVGKMQNVQGDVWNFPPMPMPLYPQSRHLDGNGPIAAYREAGLEDDHTVISPMRELAFVYRRLDDTLVKNALPAKQPRWYSDQRPETDLTFRANDTLAKILGCSISCLEIQQRGVGGPPGLTLLDNIPSQALTHLRVLSETALTYVTFGGIRHDGNNPTANEFSQDYERQYRRLFLRDPYGVVSTETIMSQIRPLLRLDVFVFLTECSLCLAEVDLMDIMHLVRLCYVAELVKVILELGHNMNLDRWLEMLGYHDTDTRKPGFGYLADFCILLQRFKESLGAHKPAQVQSLNGESDDLSGVASFIRKYALVFLRKIIILLNVRYGVAFHNSIPSDPQDDELDRLHAILNLDPLDQIYRSITFDDPSLTFGQLIHAWMKHAYTNKPKDDPALINDFDKLSLGHPVIYELIGLPKNYDTLMEETMRRRCPKTGKDVSDPMLCLFCGAIFCGQSICCAKDGPTTGRKAPEKIGGAQQHMMECQRNMGLYINIRKCCVYYVYFTSGSWMVAPYIDKYGEVDPGLRHSRQLFLNQKRYDALLRTVWLSHGVPSVISRKLEMDINNGGWETI